MAQPATNPKIEELRFRLKTDPKSRLFYPLAEELRKAGQCVEAEQVLRGGLETHATYLSAWVSLGRVLRDQNKNAEAVDALTYALQLDPGNVVAARLLADAYLSLGDKVEAIKKYKLVHALLPADEALQATIAQLDRDLAPPEPELEPQPEPEPETPITDPEPLTEPEPINDPEPEPAPITDPEPLAQSPSADVLPFTPAVEAAPEAEIADVLPFAPPPDEAAAPAAAPFEETLPPFAAAIEEEARIETATADVEPMSRAHDDSPFEEPASDYSSAAFEIEGPEGMHIARAPLAAEVPAPPMPLEELPAVDAAPIAPPIDEVFEPAAEMPEAEDLTNTLTMADLYARQGLVDDARQIYDNILARDPGNDEVRARRNALLGPADTTNRGKIERLERWLSKVARREVSGV
ncbi:MAG TPA: tetratricopeptide repeat protein [Thermoanaerobaculia bacterium]|jgi:tetratricopeptide (TPR) repeat protein